MSQDDLKNMIINNPRAKERIRMKQIDHEVSGHFDLFCEHCKEETKSKRRPFTV